ncbi:MAG: hypothetical protein ACXVBE_02185 [Bdellovibrionota bacterium]
MTKLFIAIALSASLLSANAHAKVCSRIAKLCSDGSTVRADANNNCFIPECPNTRTMLICNNDILLKAEPLGTKMKAHYFIGVDINNARVWVEQNGKKFKTDVNKNEEGANFEVKNFQGKKTLKITEVDRMVYGAFLGDSKEPMKCARAKDGPPRKANDKEEEGGNEAPAE